MAEPITNLETLQALHSDLLALSESRLSSLERLDAQINAHINDFRNLLDKKSRSEQSRQSLATGKLDDAGDQYNINDEFQQESLKLADDLNLDELDSARIILAVQAGSEATGRPALTNAILRFHQRRKYLLDCLMLILQNAADVDQSEDVQNSLQKQVVRIVQPEGTSRNQYMQKCLSSMTDIKQWLQRIAERMNSASVLGQGQQPEVLETIEYQRTSLIKQHESLSIIALCLIKQGYSSKAEFESVLESLKKAEKYDNLLLHLFPVISAWISRFGGAEGGGELPDARALNGKIFTHLEDNPWTLPYVSAAFRVWWLSEYSGWYSENHDGSIPESQLEQEAKQRSKQFADALKDGAFDFILSLSADVKSVEWQWQDPARHGLRVWLQQKAPVVLADSVPFSDFFQEALMEQLETFIEGFITNLPDVLRKLRVDEDEQRQFSKDHEHELNLEKFLVIISYTFEGRPKAALEGFWDVADGALLGFVQWASRRASTPLVSAFCEMLQAISEDEECATAAHKLLLDDHAQSSGKMRRTHSLTWNQIFRELQFFSLKIRDRPAIPQPQAYRGGKPHSEQMEVEPESSLMLECYLRLISRFCTVSGVVREFLVQNDDFHIIDLLFQLASSSIGPRLRACAFATLQSLLSQKTRQRGESMWESFDVWIAGGYSPGSAMPKTSFTSSSAASAGRILSDLASGFEQPNAFVQFLEALLSPYNDESDLNGGLPFPENLGVSYRQPGIDPYIDSALGEIFGTRATELNEPLQVKILQLTCLNFIATCLDTFNEDLVVFASQSNISIDSAIRATNLQTYVLLHPFSRVMEWMFNEKVMHALFATVHQDAAEVARSGPNSPLVQCLLRGLHVIGTILDLQPTYLDIIRPLVKSQPNYRRVPVSNAAFGSFEDGVLSHLSIIPDLGRYCSSGHPELIIASLRLLEKLSSSPKLASAPSSRLGRRSDRNKALAALDEDAETVSQTLLGEMITEIDRNQGPQSPAYIIKDCILNFLITCLRSAPGQQTIAHLLLGFRCGSEGLSIEPESPFSREVSLFHTILNLVLSSNIADNEGTIVSWLVSLNHKGLQVLKELWLSPISSELTMIEMRANNSFFILFVKEIVLGPEISWDGIYTSDPLFPSTGATCLSEFLCRRALILQYLSAELRQVTRSHSPSLKQRIFETLLGSTTVEDGSKTDHATVFDLFDFMEPDFPPETTVPQLDFFQDLNLYACLDNSDDPSSTWNLDQLEKLLVLKRAELGQEVLQANPQVLTQVNFEAQGLLDFAARDNQAKVLSASRLKVLRGWVQITLVMIESGEFDSTSKIPFVLKTLQTIMPRLESDLGVVSEAIELARLAKSLVFSLDFGSEVLKQGDMGEVVSDRLFHLFQVSLRAINTLGAQVTLKEYFYNICYRYLTGMSDITGVSGVHRRHSIQTIKSAGERFIDLICDDAHSGEPTCRIAALLVLGALVKMGKNENSKYIVDSLNRLNFIGVLVDSIQGISVDLRETSIEDMQLSYCHARLALLLHISQTRFGATAILNAGLFHSIQASGLFATDPDLGVDIDGPGAIVKHYDLLAAVMRIICACILSRGIQNQQSLEHGRKFLTENRLAILAVLKKSAGLGAAVEISEQSIDELADSFMLLISVTGFLDFEEQTTQKKQAKVFTAFT